MSALPLATTTVTLDGDTDWPGFRREARALLARGTPPDAVEWHTQASAAGDLFASAGADVDAVSDEPGETPATTPTLPVPATASKPSTSSSLSVPPAFIQLCETVVLHSDPGRFGLLYRLLWRLQHEPGLRHDPLDADRVQAQHMAQAVRRDMHKMKAFVRFRTLAGEDAASPLHVAWFEPEHHIVEAVAPFFVRRFTQMRWAILTPERSVEWNGESLRFGPGAIKQDAPPADAGEALWLVYYRHIFNPARLKLAMMQKEMPRRYWRNLPEAELISPLASEAMARSGRMVDAGATEPARRIAPLPRPPSVEMDMTQDVSTFDLSDDPRKALEQLARATNVCRECPIGEHATQSVFGEGPVHATLMVVGEQPGDQEDLRGRPFVGPAGKLFDRAMADLGWPRDRLWVTNAVKHFKFELRGKRRIHKTPSQQEAAACLHWLESEIAQVRPVALIALGATAARALLGRPVAVMRERGQWHESPRGEKVLVTLHPSALLRGDPQQHEEAYAAWLNDLSQASGIALDKAP
ncbi:MAG: UdgX family uracil-DNA binding protein [Gammaproteobacteria bacterium]|nr:UdgX family uracil-DNA binding protein [Gammaproteobacteria bacterium]MBU1439708.1 UdgX family uracil-DNA binding protein [Gammaproteobacteria bacterium]